MEGRSRKRLRGGRGSNNEKKWSVHNNEKTKNI